MRKMKNYNFVMLLLPALLILSDAISTADRLSGKFFGSSIPFLENFYANDFLTFGIILFSALGVVLGNISLVFIKDKRWEYALVFVMLTILLFMLHNFSNNLWLAESDDFNTLSRLLDNWSFAFFWSGMIWPISKFAEILRSGNSNKI
jgi:hypothetical protein